MRPIISLLSALVIAWPCSANPLGLLAGSPPVVSGTDLKTDLVAWFDLADATDAHGALDLSTTGSYASYVTTGKPPNSLDLEQNSGNTYLYSDESAFDITGEFTIAAWVNLESTSLYGRAIVAKYESQAGNLRSFTFQRSQSTGCLSFIVSSLGTSASTTSAAGATTINTATWYFVVAVYVPSTRMTVYVNGSQDGETTSSVPSSIYNTSVPLMIGQGAYDRTNSQYGWDGRIDSVGIWTRALTTDEITALYNSGSGLSYADL